jgi:cyclohexyl-isocyanide hydratase
MSIIALYLCVPGGFGTIEAMEDLEYLAEIRRLAEQARYVTSVCSGSLLLGAGRPERARPEIVAAAQRRLVATREKREGAARRAAARSARAVAT